jgi:Holliday junction resolvase RusA-like endonuclease
MKLELLIKIKPMPHQSVRFTKRGISYQPKKVRDYKEAIITQVKEQLPEGFQIIPKGADITIIDLVYSFAYPKSMPKKKRVEGMSKTTKPDLHDNLNKALFDALEGVVWEQDQNVSCIQFMRKCYTEEDYIRIVVSCLNY